MEQKGRGEGKKWRWRNDFPIEPDFSIERLILERKRARNLGRERNIIKEKDISVRTITKKRRFSRNNTAEILEQVNYYYRIAQCIRNRGFQVKEERIKRN